jgi:anaerobic magnesium-protoporphyrin IX monomethyl ester cyclase
MKVLFINPSTSFEQIYGDWDLSPLDTYSPPLGILHLASYIREHGHDPYVLDIEAKKMSLEEVLKYITKLEPEVIGITSMTINFSHANSLAVYFKEKLKSVPIIIGGAHITATASETMLNYTSFDFGVVGEGEETLLEIINRLAENKTPEDIKGLIWRNKNSEVIINEPRPYITDLDRLPFPAWDLLDGFPERYPHSILESKRLPTASVMTSRGCPYQCTFCDNKIFGTKVRHFSADYSIRMIKHLTDNYNIRDLMILDDNFLVSREKLFTICDTLVAEKIDLTWYCMGHAKTMTGDRLKKIKEAGCWFIELGIESGNDKMLKKIRKNTTKDEIARAVKLAKRCGLKTKGNFIFGFPGDTNETLNESAKFAREIQIDYFQQNFLTVWPGCEIYNQIKNDGDLYEYYDSSWDSLAHQRITFVPKGLSKKEIIAASKIAFRRFYLRPGIIIGLLPLITTRRGIKFLFVAFKTFIITIFRKES